jgi:hypothetical protein
VGEAARKSLREIGSIFFGVCFTKFVLYLISVHYNPLVEVSMETALHSLALLLLHMATTPSSVASLHLAVKACLLLGPEPPGVIQV